MTPNRDRQILDTMPKKRERWRAVKAAQSYLAGEALAITKSLVKAAKDGDTATGRWLLEHTAIASPDGAELRPVAPSINRPTIQSGASEGNAPRIMIGVSLGNDFAQLAPGASTQRLNAQPRELPAVSPTSTPHHVSPIEATRENIGVIEAVPVLASHEHTDESA